MYDKKAVYKYRQKNREKYNLYQKELLKSRYTKSLGQIQYAQKKYRDEARIFRNILI